MTSGPGPLKDSLADWLRIRPEIAWPSWRGAHPTSGAPDRDGFRNFFTATRGGRDSEGTERVLAALDSAFAEAERRRPLTFTLIAKWQQTVLGHDIVGFRMMPAFAKGGRERYGFVPDRQARFERCLSESAQSENHLADEYGVARLTARRAAQELRERGLIITVRGKGSFVVDQPPAKGGTTA